MSDILDRVPPHSLEAERALLGSAMLDNYAASVMFAELSEGDFYRGAHQIVFSAIAKIMSEGGTPDIITVWDALRSSGHIEMVGGEQYLREIVDEVPVSSNAAVYSRLVREYRYRREVLFRSIDLLEMAHTSPLEDLAEKMAVVPELPAKISDVTLRSIVGEIFERWDRGEKPEKIPTGLDILDDAMDGGLVLPEFTVIAGRPSSGKSSLASQIAINASRAGFRVLIASVEMSMDMTAMRMIASLGGLDFRAVRRGECDISGPCAELAELPLRMIRSFRHKEIMAAVRDAQLVVIDHLNDLRLPGGKDRADQRGRNMIQDIKSGAAEAGAHMILLAQLNRDVEKRGGNAKPQKSDLREFGALEETADNLLFTHRPTKGGVEVIIGKQRNGPAQITLTGLQVDDAKMKWTSNYIPSGSGHDSDY